jgi:hypothetical protein
MLDEGVWAIVDEGANSCCHGDEWRRNAEDKIYNKGFRFNAVHHRATEFKSIGNRRTTGLWNVPLGFTLQDTRDTYQGVCHSHELANCKFPMLLSQSVQAHLHFIKDMAQGTIMLGDTGEYLEVVRQVSTGLFMLRTDHLDVRSFEEEIESSAMADKLILPDQVLEELKRYLKKKMPRH